MMEKVPSELLTCPICFEMPEGYVFQCRNGHSICQRCFSSVPNCPKSRVPYDPQGIRNLALEELVGALQIVCKHKEHGCQEKIKRKDLTRHLETCKFGSVKPIYVCKFVGWDCNFASAKSSDIFQHYTTGDHDHKGFVHSKPFSRHSLKPDLDIMKKGKEQRAFLHRIIEIGNSSQFMEVSDVNTSKGEYSLHVMHFSDDGKTNSCPYTVTISFIAPIMGIKWRWRITPTHCSDLEHILQNPTFKIPIQFFLDGMNEPGSIMQINYSLD